MDSFEFCAGCEMFAEGAAGKGAVFAADKGSMGAEMGAEVEAEIAASWFGWLDVRVGEPCAAALVAF